MFDSSAYCRLTFWSAIVASSNFNLLEGKILQLTVAKICLPITDKSDGITFSLVQGFFGYCWCSQQIVSGRVWGWYWWDGFGLGYRPDPFQKLEYLKNLLMDAVYESRPRLNALFRVGSRHIPTSRRVLTTLIVSMPAVVLITLVASFGLVTRYSGDNASAAFRCCLADWCLSVSFFKTKNNVLLIWLKTKRYVFNLW